MRSPYPIPSLALLLSLAGCVQSSDCSTCGSEPLYETEINDTAPQADWMGWVYPDEDLLIAGHITQWGPDLYDGFAFATAAALQIEVRLWADDPYADLDLCVWDPQLAQFVACFESDARPEGGSFVILESGKEFHLVVRSYSGDSSYQLEVLGLKPVYGSAAAPSSTAARPGAEGAWRAYGQPASVPRAALELPRALFLEFDEQGQLIQSLPLRVLPLERA